MEVVKVIKDTVLVVAATWEGEELDIPDKLF